jgi:hypothetical protein
MAPNGPSGSQREASQNPNDGNHSQKFDQGESGWPTQRTPSPDRVGVRTGGVVFRERNTRSERSGLGVRKYFLVERGKGGCSHSDEPIVA